MSPNWGAVAILALATKLQGQELDLKALVQEALSNNREVLAAQKRYEASQQRPSQIGRAHV